MVLWYVYLRRFTNLERAERVVEDRIAFSVALREELERVVLLHDAKIGDGLGLNTTAAAPSQRVSALQSTAGYGRVRQRVESTAFVYCTKATPKADDNVPCMRNMCNGTRRRRGR